MDMNEPSILYWIPIALLCYAIKVFIDVFKWLTDFKMNLNLFDYVSLFLSMVIFILIFIDIYLGNK